MTARETSETADVTRRGLVRPSHRHSRAKQLAALVAARCGVIYIVAERFGRETLAGGIEVYANDDAIEQWRGSLRKGWTGVVTDLSRAGTDRRSMMAAVTEAHRVGAHIEETPTGRCSDDVSALPGMIADALEELAGGPSRYDSARGKAAAEKRHAAERADKDVMSVSAARAIWRDVDKYPTVADALAAMPGWHYNRAYRVLRRRYKGDPSRGGRPRKVKG